MRFSPALANKPNKTSSLPRHEPQPKPFNPFEAPPPALTVAAIEPDHLLVLNKFAIVPEHSILITRAFQPQTHLLAAGDLAAAHACTRAYRNDAQRAPDETDLFVFFNSGAHSGASQPHRHLQLLPVARMRDGLAAGAGWQVLADQVVRDDDDDEPRGGSRPFFTAGERLPPGIDAEALLAVYLRLYRIACSAAGAGRVSTAAVAEGLEARISYNLAMTADSMVIMPRTAEGAVVRDKQGREVGLLALNGTVLAGTALAKNEAEWDALREDPEQLLTILRQIGVDPKTVDPEQMARDILPQL